jgi:serine/threonine-protein kinase
MGEVFVADRADDQYTSRVALKLLRPGLDDRSFVRRFLEERQILASLVHPRIARLYDGGMTDDGRPWFAMEYVEGLPIDRFCDDGELSIERRLELFLQVCDTVAFAHTHGVIHRDLKPSNILVDDRGEARLVDFGIAKVASQPAVDAASSRSHAEQAMGTPQYSSPEQTRGDPVTAANDVYSLGVVLYRLLAGVHPNRVTIQAPDATSFAVPGAEPIPPSEATAQGTDGRRPERATQLKRRLRGDLDAIVLKMLRTDPAQRYATVDDLAADIRRHLGRWPVAAMRNSLPYRIR